MLGGYAGMLLFALISMAAREGEKTVKASTDRQFRFRALSGRRYGTGTSWGHDMRRVGIMKDALLNEINAHIESLPACRNLRALDLVHDPARIRGANWTMQQFRRSGPNYNEAECQLAIGEFMSDMQERYDIVE